MWLDQLRRDSKIKRRIQLGSIILAIGGVAVAAIVLTLLALSAREDTADRYAAVGAVFAGAAVFLAIIAAVVALLAFAASTGSPDVQLRLLFEYSHPNNPSFKANIQNNGWLKAEAFKQTTAQVSLHNVSRYSAVNPSVVIRLRGMAYLEGFKRENTGWTRMEFANTVGVTAVQWDGGPQYSIHGESTRVLPVLFLDVLWHIPEWGSPAFIVEILAEGYRREVTIPVTFKIEGQPEPTEGEARSLPDWM